MKRAALPLLLALGLAGCGAAPLTAPQASELLSAPTQLSLGGQRLTAQAQATLSGPALTVRLRVQTSRAPLPAVRVTNLYLVSSSGVWSAAVEAGGQSRCAGGRCVQGQVSGSSRGLKAGQSAQVVARLQDTGGRVLWLRAPAQKLQAR